jgi:hypothetical protein
MVHKFAHHVGQVSNLSLDLRHNYYLPRMTGWKPVLHLNHAVNLARKTRRQARPILGCGVPQARDDVEASGRGFTSENDNCAFGGAEGGPDRRLFHQPSISAPGAQSNGQFHQNAVENKRGVILRDED